MTTLEEMGLDIIRDARPWLGMERERKYLHNVHHILQQGGLLGGMGRDARRVDLDLGLSRHYPLWAAHYTQDDGWVEVGLVVETKTETHHSMWFPRVDN